MRSSDIVRNNCGVPLGLLRLVLLLPEHCRQGCLKGEPRATPWEIEPLDNRSPVGAPLLDGPCVMQPFQGTDILGRREPRALPWATLDRPYRTEVQTQAFAGMTKIEPRE